MKPGVDTIPDIIRC